MADYWDTLELVADGKTIDDEVLDFTDTTDQGTTAVKTMGRRRRAVGYMDKTVDITFELTVASAVSPRVNWRQWQLQKKVFQLNVRENKGGPLEQFVDCRVLRVARSAGDGTGSWKVSCMALDYK